MLKLYILLCLSFLGGTFINAQTRAITVNGTLRSYILYVPPGHDASTPSALVLNFHGYGSNAGQQQGYTSMLQVADTADFIIVYPEGLNNAWNSFTPLQTTPDDVAFTSAIIDDVNRTLSIDPARVYACGMSNGGYMSYLLACELENRIAAIVSVTGLLSPGYMSTCNPARPMPIMQIHGTTDATVPYNGGIGIGSVDSTMQFWLNKNNCNAANTIIDTLPNTNATDNSYPIRYSTLNCDANTEVSLIKIVGGGHTWPNGVISLPGATTNRDIDGSTEVWAFFSKYVHPNPDPMNTVTVPTGVKAVNSNLKLVKTYPNPIGNVLSVEVINEQVKHIALFDVLGVKIQDAQVSGYPSTLKFNTANLQSGIYFLQVETPTGKTTYKLVK